MAVKGCLKDGLGAVFPKHGSFPTTFEIIFSSYPYTCIVTIYSLHRFKSTYIFTQINLLKQDSLVNKKLELLSSNQKVCIGNKCHTDETIVLNPTVLPARNSKPEAGSLPLLQRIIQQG